MTKWLICPAPPRSGTTYLFQALAAPANAKYIQTPRNKEVHWLQRGHPDRLDEEFGPSTTDRFYLDFSPGYTLRPAPFWDIVRTLPTDGSVKFVIPLRDPIDQTFAHYLHDLKAHVTQERDRDISYPFLGYAAMARYFADRSKIFGQILERFGADNVLFLNFHRMFDDIAATERSVAKLLGVERIQMLPHTVGAGGWLPKFLYGGESGVDCIHGNFPLSVPARALVLLNGSQSRIKRDVPEIEAGRIIARAASWQGHLSPRIIRQLDQHVLGPTVAAYSALLGTPIAEHRPRSFRASSAPIPAAIMEALQPAEALPERLALGARMAAR